MLAPFCFVPLPLTSLVCSDYRSELDSIKSDEPPEFTPGSGAEEMCHPILKRLELFKRTVEHELLKEPGHFELVSCVMYAT